MSVQKVDNLPVFEIEEVRGEGHYVKLDGRQVARFAGLTAYDDATRCCATLIEREIAKLGEQPEVLRGWKHVRHDSYELGALVIRGAGNHWDLIDGRWYPEPHLGTFGSPQAAAQEADRLYREDPELRQGEGQEQQPYQVRDGNTGTVLGVYPTIDDANEVAFSIENGAPYAGVPASALAVEFWRRQPDGTYKQMTPRQVERDLGVGPPELGREPVAPHQQYRALLEQISDLRYPDADAALRRKIESSIDRKVGQFMAERGELPTHARAHQLQQQQMQPPPPRQQQRGMDRGGYEQ